MTTYTPNYHLPLYEDSDKPNLRDQYNGAINAIDTQFADVATDNTTTQNLIANINRDIEAANTAIAKVNEDISALQTVTSGQTASITTLTDHLNTVDSELGQVGAKVATNANNIATQSAYWSGLGVTDIDEALDLKKDIDDAHTTSMTNQADIAQIKATQVQQGNTLSTHTGQIQNIGEDITILEGNVQALSSEFDRTLAYGWDVYDVPCLIPTIEEATIFLNKAKNLIKLSFGINPTLDQLNSSISQIAGGSGSMLYGQKLYDLSSLITPPEEMIVYKYVAPYRTQGGTSQFTGETRFDHLVLGTDGCLYFNPSPNSSGWSGYSRIAIYALQPLLSLEKYNVNPPVVPKDE